MKRLLTLLLTAILALSSATLIACGNSGGGDKYSSRPNKVTLAYAYGGYGTEYWDVLAKDFMDNYSEDIYLVMEPIYDVNARPRIQGGTPDGDIVAVSQDMFRNSTVLEELTDLLNRKALGEEKTIKEKIGQDKYDYYYEGSLNGIYQLPGGNGYGYNWAYNKSVLDEAFKGDYTLPKTSKEFFAFGDELLEKEIFLTSAALKETSDDYLVYAFQVWFAQMVGAEGYTQFYSGNYFNKETSKYELAETSPLNIETNKQAILSAYEVAHKLCYRGNDYLHPSSASMKLMDNNQVFAGGGYSFNEAKSAFLFTGAWYEHEIRDLVKDELVEQNVYGAMRVPVISDIVLNLEYRGENNAYMTDEMLSQIVTAVDEGKTSFDGVSQNDFDRIKEARNMLLEQICSELVIPTIKEESKRESIYTVLQYLATDHAQELAAKTMGGIGMFQFGYTVDFDKLGITPTNLVKDFNDIKNTAVTIDHACVNNTFKRASSIEWYTVNSGVLASSIYDMTEDSKNADSKANALKMYDSLIGKYSGRAWTTAIETYKEAVGLK